VRNSDGQYSNKYLCQMSIDRPPGRRDGEENIYLYYPVSKAHIAQPVIFQDNSLMELLIKISDVKETSSLRPRPNFFSKTKTFHL